MAHSTPKLPRRDTREVIAPNAFVSWASTATPGGVVGAIIGFLAWSEWAGPTDCGGVYCPDGLDVGLFIIQSQAWAVAVFGIVGVFIGFAIAHYKGER